MQICIQQLNPNLDMSKAAGTQRVALKTLKTLIREAHSMENKNISPTSALVEQKIAH